MKRNNLFYRPQRQSQFAIIFIILKTLRRLFSQVWPFLIAFFLGRNQRFDTLELALAGVGLLGIIPAIISYYKYYFHATDEELIIEHGIFRKTKLNIPFARIQSVNFRQNPIHQILNVTEVIIETAGSAEQETQIDALDWITAKELRKFILNKKNESIPQSEVFENIEEEEEDIVLTLTPLQLLKIGLLQNPFRPLSVLISIFFTIIFYSLSFDYNIKDIYNNIISFEFTLFKYFLIGIFLIIFGLGYSIITIFLKYYDLTFWRSKDKFNVAQGLFTKKQFTAIDTKIQMINWGQNWLERKFGIYNLEFRQARSSGKSELLDRFNIPGIDIHHIKRVHHLWLNTSIGEVTGLQVSKHLFWHALMYIVPFTIGLSLLAFYFLSWQYGWLILLGGSWILFLNYLNWKKTRYQIINDMLYVGGGVLGLRHIILPDYKIQNIAINENIYQKRRNLATLVIYTAAGSVSIPYIKKEKAINLLNELLYRVEISHRSWM